jgi:hypothetical protein
MTDAAHAALVKAVYVAVGQAVQTVLDAQPRDASAADVALCAVRALTDVVAIHAACYLEGLVVAGEDREIAFVKLLAVMAKTIAAERTTLREFRATHVPATTTVH